MYIIYQRNINPEWCWTVYIPIYNMVQLHKEELIYYWIMCYTFEHSSVAKYLAIEQRETFSGQSSSKALAAILTMFRDVTSLVAMSANVNCRCFKIKNLFNQNVFPWFLSAYKCTKIHACIKQISTVVQLYLKMIIYPYCLTWKVSSVFPNCFLTLRWSLVSSILDCAAPNEHEAVKRTFSLVIKYIKEEKPKTDVTRLSWSNFNHKEKYLKYKRSF